VRRAPGVLAMVLGYDLRGVEVECLGGLGLGELVAIFAATAWTRAICSAWARAAKSSVKAMSACLEVGLRAAYIYPAAGLPAARGQERVGVGCAVGQGGRYWRQRSLLAVQSGDRSCGR
jgi:hypothetical protein